VDRIIAIAAIDDIIAGSAKKLARANPR